MKTLRKIVLFLLVFCFVFNTIGIGTYASSDSAILEVVKDETSSLPNTGKKIKFVLKGTNLKEANIKTKVVNKETKIREKSIETTLVEETNDDRNTTNVKVVSIDFPENKDTKSKVYVVTFNSTGNTGDNDFNEEYKTEVKVRKGTGTTTPEVPSPTPTPNSELPNPEEPTPVPPTTEGKVLGSEVTEKTLESKGGEFEFALFTSKNVSSEVVKVKVTCDGESTDIGNNATVSGEGARKLVKVNFPENMETKEKVYKLTFNAKNSVTDFQDEPVVLVKINPSKSKEMIISDVKLSKPNLPKEGGTTKLNIKGENLDKSKIVVKIFKDDVLQSDLVKNIEFNGTEEILSCFLNFPRVAESKDTYKIKVYELGKEEVKGECEVVVGENTSGELMALNPTSVFVDKNGKNITIKFDEKIFAVGSLYNLKSGILLDIDGDGHFDKLSDRDSIVIDNDRIIITLDKNITVKLNSKVIVQERMLKDSQNREGSQFEFFITKAKPMIQKVEFLEGELLESTGGMVKIKFTGENLDNTLVKVVKIKKHSESTDEINVNVETLNEKEQIISFNVPENNGNTAESYIVKASLDEGKTYTSLLGVNMYDRTKRLVVTVLPKGADKTKPILSFMTIQSYGTSGGGTDVPDNTHTNSRIGQESKKTFVYVYGANLEKNLTKVKIVDKNGIEWTPVNDPASDSMDQFIMVGFDGTGIDGWGNNQMIEIICPRNIVGDNTYKYLVAVDGVNFNEEIFVTATVLDDGDRPKHEATPENIKTVTVKYQDKEGKEISKSKTIKGYTWTKAVSFGIDYKEIENYKLIGYKTNVTSEVKPIIILNEKLKDADEIIFVYEKTTTEDKKVFVSEDNKMSVETMSLDPTTKLVYEKLSTENKNEEIFDIYFVDKDGNKIEAPIGDYLVKIKKDKTKEVGRVFNIDDKNINHNLDFKDMGEYVEFKTTHFSKYALEFKENKKKITNINKETVKNSKKTMPTTALSAVGFMPLILSGLGLVALKKRK